MIKRKLFYYRIPKSAIKYALDFHKTTGGSTYRIDTYSPIFQVEEMDGEMRTDNYDRYLYLSGNEIESIDKILEEKNLDSVYISVGLSGIGSLIKVVTDSEEIDVTDYSCW